MVGITSNNISLIFYKQLALKEFKNYFIINKFLFKIKNVKL